MLAFLISGNKISCFSEPIHTQITLLCPALFIQAKAKPPLNGGFVQIPLKEPQHSPTQSYKSASRTDTLLYWTSAWKQTLAIQGKGRLAKTSIHSAQQSRQNRRAHSFCTATYFCSSKQQWHAAGSSSTKGRRIRDNSHLRPAWESHITFI